MRVILASVLGIWMVVFAIFRDIQIPLHGEYAWLVAYIVKSVITLACFVGIWYAMKETQAELESTIGPMALEPGWDQVKGWSQMAGRTMAGVVSGGMAAITGGARKATKFAAAAAGRPDILRHGVLGAIAEARKKARQRNQAEKAMKKLGFDPHSEEDRQRYLEHMKAQGDVSTAVTHLMALSGSKATKAAGVTSMTGFPELKANMTSGAREIFRQMSKAGYSPYNYQDRQTYLKAHPEAAMHMKEIENWIKLPDSQKLTSVPMRGASLPPVPPAEFKNNSGTITYAESLKSTGGRLPWPINGEVSSPFGPRWGRHHDGIDIAAPMGTPVYAPADGVVVESRVASGYGWMIMIDHGNGLATLYGHSYPNQVKVHVGDHVKKGQQITAVGNNGRSTGAHLHFEVRVNGTPVDPMQWLTQ
jgi:murein DD-endopeptidase MepM/ murein hydrolase activator NlpD